MNFQIAGHTAYAYTGGKTIDAGLPTIVFLHGAQHDHSVWGLQSRYLAHHGFNVLAVDLPGHHRSDGAPLTTVGALSDWVVQLLDLAGVARATLVGHSMGSMIALDAAGRHPDRVERIALIASAYPMRVADTLLRSAAEQEPAAIAMVNMWSHSTIAAKPSAPGPGFWTLGVNQRLMERVAQRNPAKVFLTDFAACNGYDGGFAAAANVRCPVLAVLGRQDQMTPPRAAAALLDALRQTGAPVTTTLLESGHAIMSEQPDALLDALLAFVRH
ncbi:alpha/beta hydrolase [Pandoraea terrae]|uniref:Alpha/beta hydrolase n=1 Tax=Pandoraea terrae TaxID=1537710 RepID=A0A5E4WNN8_9BURK|nr:alpha/beta hydrolase [Pandoraea terrae]VVE25773.1 alpha/beta hydrolase [Pandoraea terrae]